MYCYNLKRSVGKASAINCIALFLILVFGISGALAADKVIKFGCSISVSGVFAREGKCQKDGLDLWKETVNKTGGINVGGEKYNVDIVYYDDKSDTITSTKLVEKLITEDKVKFIFAPFGSGATLASSSVTEKYKTLMMTPMGSAPGIYTRGYKYLFSAELTSDLSWQSTTDAFIHLSPRPQTIAIIAQNTMWPLSVAAEVKKYSEQRGLKTVYNEKFPAGTEDFSSLLTEVKRYRPDILVANSYNKEEILMAKQIRELRVNVPLLVMPGSPSTDEFSDALGDTAEYITYENLWTWSLPYKGKMFGTSRDFSRLMKERYNYEVDYVGALGAVSGVIYQLAIERAGSLDIEKVRQAIKDLKDITFYGPIKFDDRGINVGSSSNLMQIQGGKRVCVWPADHATAKIKYPMPKWEER